MCGSKAVLPSPSPAPNENSQNIHACENITHTYPTTSIFVTSLVLSALGFHGRSPLPGMSCAVTVV